jgi:glutathione S-transferase
MLKLFHNGMSTCSQKVRLVLAELNLNFESEIMDLQKGDQFSSQYLQLNPQALVPSLLVETEGKKIALVESSLICQWLDDSNSAASLTPKNIDDRYTMRWFLQQIDHIQHPACSILTYALGLRAVMLTKEPAELQSMIEQIRDPARREGRRAVLDKGVNAPVFRSALKDYLNVLVAAEAQLNHSTWLAGEYYSLADAALTPYILRLQHLELMPLVERFPLINAWYSKIQLRDNWQDAIAKWLPERAVLAFSNGAKEHQQTVCNMAAELL